MNRKLIYTIPCYPVNINIITDQWNILLVSNSDQNLLSMRMIMSEYAPNCNINILNINHYQSDKLRTMSYDVICTDLVISDILDTINLTGYVFCMKHDNMRNLMDIVSKSERCIIVYSDSKLSNFTVPIGDDRLSGIYINTVIECACYLHRYLSIRYINYIESMKLDKLPLSVDIK